MRLTQIVEALLFASDAPLTAADLARADERLDEDTVTAVIDTLREEYDRTERAFQVYEVAGGYQLLTRPDYASVLDRYQSVPQSARLSMPALEVLAILAYRQPLGRLEIEEIRGVQSSAVLRTLQDRELIQPVGRSEALGRPLLYGTTEKFLEHFGFRSLEDMPRPDELPVILRPRAATDPEPAPAPFGAAEPSPLSPGAEVEAEALHLGVHPAREHGSSPSRTEEGPVADHDPLANEADIGLAGDDGSDEPIAVEGDERRVADPSDEEPDGEGEEAEAGAAYRG